MKRLEAAFVLIRAEAEERRRGSNNDPVSMLHSCQLEVGILIDKEIAEMREEERRRKAAKPPLGTDS